MTLNYIKLGRAVKYLASVVSLMFLQETLIWNKITLRLSNLLNLSELVLSELTKNLSELVLNELTKNLSELVLNELTKGISKKNYQYSFFCPIYY